MASPEDFSKVGAGVQSFVTAFALAIGGIWVLFTFWKLRSINKARAELAELEQRTLEQPVLNAQLTASVIEQTVSARRLISLTVTLRNDGKRGLRLEDYFAQAAALSIDKDTLASKGPAVKTCASVIGQGKLTTLTGARILRSGQARSMIFLFPAEASGPYLVEFHATYTGMKLVDGVFVDSSDEYIEAIEQLAMNVPA